MSRLGYKLAIVTEGAQGFGAQAAEALARDGATILLTGTQDDEGEASAAALRARGCTAEYHHLDAPDPLSWAQLVDKIMRTHGHLDILVNHAGASLSVTIEDATPAQLRAILETNLTGPFLGIKAVLPAMRQSGGGSIINIAGNDLVAMLPLFSLYNAAKGALAELTKSTAVHCFQRGYDIRVNTVHPGAHETPALNRSALRSAEARTLHKLLSARPQPDSRARRDFGETIAFLASDESVDITASAFYCTGTLAALTFDGRAALQEQS